MVLLIFGILLVVYIWSSRINRKRQKEYARPLYICSYCQSILEDGVEYDSCPHCKVKFNK